MKIKPLTKEQILISTDRLTRFKLPEERYLRVFGDIVSWGLLEPVYKKNELENIDFVKLTQIVSEIINFSLKSLGLDLVADYSINDKILNYEKSLFNISKNTEILLKNEINYRAITEIIEDDSVFNLRWLKTLKTSDISSANRKANLYPVEKVVLVEGITEEILLPEFAKILGYNFKENGVFVISAGGKSQVVKYFYKYSEAIKIPIFVLMDSDAKENYAQIKPKLRKNDCIHLIKNGEFEDILPKQLVKRAINSETCNISVGNAELLENSVSTVKFLEDFFKNRGLHEFKKAEFAQIVKENLLGMSDISSEILEIIRGIESV